MKKFLSIFLVVLVVVMCVVPVLASNNDHDIAYWQNRQAKCHEAADLLRALEFPGDISWLGEEWYHCRDEINALKAEEAAQAAATKKEINVYDYFTESDICTLSEVMYAEYNGIVTILGEEKGGREVRRIGWCIMNRVDEWGGTLQSQANASGQFAHSYNSTPYYKYAKQMLEMYLDEKLNGADVRELDRKYKWYGGNGTYNTFRSYCYTNGGANHGWNLQVDREWQS